MKVEEYSDLISKLIADPGNSAKIGSDILEAIKADDANRAADAETIKAQSAKIAELNAAIFTQSTGKPPDEKEEHEETPREAFNRLFDERYYPEEGK